LLLIFALVLNSWKPHANRAQRIFPCDGPCPLPPRRPQHPIVSSVVYLSEGCGGSSPPLMSQFLMSHFLIYLMSQFLMAHCPIYLTSHPCKPSISPSNLARPLIKILSQSVDGFIASD
jgi:hypothetical protein